MDYDRGKRGRIPNRRFTNRGYRRGNMRGNYYPWRPNWSHNNHYNSHYLYPPRPPKPPSPLPGTEEYRQRNIQQTSELIKKQLNIDGSLCTEVTVGLTNETKTTENITEQKKEETSPSNVNVDQKKTKNKKNQVEEEAIDVQEIYDKIIKHISNMSYSKKLNLINQSNSGYDIAIQQIQKQKQLELSKALRDMSQRPILDTDEEVIQSIIPDIGIKIEDLPNDVIKELSKTLQVKFESDETDMEVKESKESQVIDMSISPENTIVEDTNGNNKAVENKKVEDESEKDGSIDNIFGFEYLNKTENDDNYEESKPEVVERMDESEFSMANIDVTKSYLDMPIGLDFNKCSGSGVIRVKTDIFQSPEKEKIKDLSNNPVFIGKLCPANTENISNENKNSSPKSTLEKETPKENPSPEHTKSSLNNSTNQNDSNPSNKSTTEENNKIVSPISASFERIIQTHFSPLLRDVQTPTNQLFTTEQPKKWKSPGEKKMLPLENNQPKTPISTEINQQGESSTKEKEIVLEKKVEDKKQVVEHKKKKKQKVEKVKPPENENKQSKNPKISQDNLITFKEMGTMVNFDSKHKRKKRNIEVQTDLDSNLLLKPKEIKETSTMTDFTTNLVTVSAQTPMKFFKKNYQSKSNQTSLINWKSIDVQATEKMKTSSTQTDNLKESDDYKRKNVVLLSQLKLMQQIDEEIRELLIKKKSLYDNLEVLGKGDISPKSSSYKKKKSRKHEQIKTEKLIDEPPNKTEAVKNEDQVELTNQVELNLDITPTEQEVEDITIKIKPKTKEIKEKERIQQSPIQKEQHKPSSTSSATSSTPIESNKEKPLKLSLRIEKDENNVKKYSLKRDRSLSKDKEPKRCTSSIEIHEESAPEISVPADKRFKISKDIERLVYNDNKFLKKCCVKLKPLKNNEYIKDNTMENEYEKTLEHLEESSRSPGRHKEIHSGRNSAMSEQLGEVSPRSSCSTSSNVSAKPKSKVIDKLEFKGLTGSIFSLKVVDGNLLAAGDNGILYIYNVVSQELMATIQLSTQALTCLHVTKVVNNNECLIYVGCLDGQLRIVNYTSQEIEQTINIDHPIQCMDISWDTVFMGSTTGDLSIYNSKTSKLDDSIHIFDNRIYTIKAMQEGPRRVLLIGTKDTELSIRDAMTGLLMREFKTNFSPTIYSILCEENLVYCGTNQHDVLAYSFQDGELIKRYEGIASRRVICMQIVNNLLFVGCFNGSVCVFHKATHQYLGHMIRPGESLLSMIIVNNKVIVGLKNNKLVIWDVPDVYLEKNR